MDPNQPRIVDKVTSLFRDDNKSGNERKHHDWLRTYFPDSEYLIYPNAALQAIINVDHPAVMEVLLAHADPIWVPPQTAWDPENFLFLSTVDLCVIRKSDYLPLVVFEIDGESHLEVLQQQRDRLKDALFEALDFPLKRLPVYEGQPDEEKLNQLAPTISELDRDNIIELSARDLQNRRSILLPTDLAKYFHFLTRTFFHDECLVFPNVALSSIFDNDQVQRCFEKLRPERNMCLTGLVDFCLLDPITFRPIVAFSLTKDPLRTKVFRCFGLPLLHLRGCEDTGN